VTVDQLRKPLPILIKLVQAEMVFLEELSSFSRDKEGFTPTQNSHASKIAMLGSLVLGGVTQDENLIQLRALPLHPSFFFRIATLTIYPDPILLLGQT